MFISINETVTGYDIYVFIRITSKFTSYSPLANGNNLCKTCRTELVLFMKGIQQQANVKSTTTPILINLKSLQ